MELEMSKEEETAEQEFKRREKYKVEEARLSAKERARVQGFLAREQEIEKAQKIKEAQRAKDLADEEIRELAKEKTRKEAYQARENEIAKEQEARRLKNMKTD
jgi:hypothetical protein